MDKESEKCESACCCSQGVGKQTWKWIVSGIVIAVAVFIVISRQQNKSTSNANDGGFAVSALGGNSGQDSASVPVEWQGALANLAQLNTAAKQYDAVLIFLPGSDMIRNAALKGEVENAATAIGSRGIKIAKYELGNSSSDYQSLSTQVGVPAVLVMVKGGGMDAVADANINKDALLKSYVTASRPGGGSCGTSASGCGPGL